MLKNVLVVAVLVLGGAVAFTSCGTNTTCPAGARRCSCTTTGACDTGLMCMDNVCVGVGAPMNFGGMAGSGNGGNGGMVGQGGRGGMVGQGGRGGTPGTGGTSGPPVCADPPMATVCDKCVDSKCCAELDFCGNSAECRAFYNCLRACPDVNPAPCEAACENMHPMGIQPLVNLFRCLDDKCTVECPVTPPPDGGAGGTPGTGGGGGGTPPGDAGPAVCTNKPNDTVCRMCVNQKCCAEFSACNGNAMCVQFDQCFNACAIGDTACENGCAMKFPGGITAYDKFSTCVNGPCGASCM
jgi:hypothetical protein